MRSNARRGSLFAVSNASPHTIMSRKFSGVSLFKLHDETQRLSNRCVSSCVSVSVLFLFDFGID